MDKLKIKIGSLELKNPVMTASGTFGYGEEYMDFYDVQMLGGIIVKGTTGEKREGNPALRLCETPMGMINAVGLQNKGVDYFCERIYPRIKDYKTNVIVNVSGSTMEEYCTVAEKISHLANIPAIELNISCPNVKKGGMGFGTNPQMAAEVVSRVRQVYDKHLMVKLTPNVTSIAEIARAVEGAGADSLSMINTVLAMAVDAEKRKAVLSTVTAHRPAMRPSSLQSSANSHRRLGRNKQRNRRNRIHFGRSECNTSGNPKLHRPLCRQKNPRRNAGIPRSPRHKPHLGHTGSRLTEAITPVRNRQRGKSQLGFPPFLFQSAVM